MPITALSSKRKELLMNHGVLISPFLCASVRTDVCKRACTRVAVCFADGRQEAVLVAPRRDYTSLVSLNGRIRHQDDTRSLPQETVRGQHMPLPEWLAAAANPGIPFSPPAPMQTASIRNKDIDALVLTLAKYPSLGKRLPRLMEWLHDCDHAFDARLCTTFISAYVRTGSPVMGLELFHWMLAQSRVNASLHPTVHTFIAAMRAASAAEAFSQVTQIWKLAQQAHMSSNERLTSVYMAALFRVNKHSQVRQLFENLRARSTQAPPQAYVVAMRSLTKSGSPEAAIELWEELQTTPAFDARSKQVYAAAISAHARAKDSRGGAAVFRQMVAAGVIPDSFACSALMHAHAALGEYSVVQSLLQKLPKWKVTGTSHMFAALMTAYVEAQEIGRAVALWRGMNSRSWKGPPANAQVLSILLCGLGKLVTEQPGAVSVAESLFAEACGTEAAAAQHLPRCRVHSRCTLEDLISRWWSSQDQYGYRDTLAACRGGGWCSHGSPQAAMPSNPDHLLSAGRGAQQRDTAVDSMRFDDIGGTAKPAQSDKGAVCASTAYAHIASAASSTRVDSLDRSIDGKSSKPRALAQMSVTGEHGKVLEGRTWGCVQRGGQFDRVSLVWGSGNSAQQPSCSLQQDGGVRKAEDMAGLGSGGEGQRGGETARAEPAKGAAGGEGEVMLHAQEAALAVRTLSLPAVPVMQPSRQHRGCFVNEVVCGALMHVYALAGQWRECTAVIGRARVLGVPPSSTMFHIAMYAAACARQPHVSEAVFQSLPGQPTRVSWETLLYAYGCSGMHDAAEEALYDMLECGTPLRDYTAVSLIQAYSEAGLWQKALQVGGRLRELKIRPTVHVLNSLLTVCVRHQKYDRGIRILQKFHVKEGPPRTAVTEALVRVVCEEEVSTIDSQQVIATALSAVAAAVGGALIRGGLF